MDTIRFDDVTVKIHRSRSSIRTSCNNGGHGNSSQTSKWNVYHWRNARMAADAVSLPLFDGTRAIPTREPRLRTSYLLGTLLFSLFRGFFFSSYSLIRVFFPICIIFKIYVIINKYSTIYLEMPYKWNWWLSFFNWISISEILLISCIVIRASKITALERIFKLLLPEYYQR